jgi:hypothetical protein
VSEDSEIQRESMQGRQNFESERVVVRQIEGKRKWQEAGKRFVRGRGALSQVLRRRT